MSPEAPAELLTSTLSVVGRIMSASNHTFLCELEDQTRCVYKPRSGERPLWDFADGTLALREYAAWLVSEHLGWDVVPPTVLRDGPAGEGMVQLWMETGSATGLDSVAVDLVPAGALPSGWLHVLDAHDQADRLIALVHEDTAALRRMAVFDVLVNNTDRKGGHVLAMSDGHRYGVDHGVCFHTDDKLRTVLWGWSGRRLCADELAGVTRLLEGLDGPLREELADLLTLPEIDAIGRRAQRLLRTRRFPDSGEGWPSIPWPPF